MANRSKKRKKKTVVDSNPRISHIAEVDEKIEKEILEAASGDAKALKKFNKHDLSVLLSLALQARNDEIEKQRDMGKRHGDHLHKQMERCHEREKSLQCAASDNARLFDKAYDKLEEELKFVRKLLVRLRGLQTQVKHEASLAQHFDEFHSIETIMQKQGKIAILRVFDETFEKLVGMVRDELDGYRLQEFLKDLRRARDNSK